jgi:hypothetical protein
MLSARLLSLSETDELEDLPGQTPTPVRGELSGDPTKPAPRRGCHCLADVLRGNDGLEGVGMGSAIVEYK